ncbi:MAG: sec-independent protein translocase protein TatB [Thiomicrorhabdus sp.]|nr:MAG: sec-independent protein translocase protein TatB [Thiomicrorhabdus sp.]
MFDIGFLEIMVILIIALLVIGPERMPEVARKIGGFMGKMRRFINSVKEDGQMQETIKDFKESMNVEEQQQQLNNINKELQSGLSFDTGLKQEDFQRPAFGGSDTEVEAVAPSQFNKAPSQPTAPQQPEASTSVEAETPVSTEQSVAVKHGIPQDPIEGSNTQPSNSTLSSETTKS